MAKLSARGPFDVKTLPQPAEADSAYGAVARLLLDKQFHGALDAVSKGQMLASGGDSGWGVYVAMEIVSGTLDGRAGSFVLYHSGTMDKNGQHLDVTVAPGSGSGDLTGITGSMSIEIVGGAHAYVLEYELPEAAHGKL